MKVFTFVSLLLMPPTLIASIYGMNINLPVAGSGLADFFILLALMIVAIFVVILVFRKIVAIFVVILVFRKRRML